VTEFSVAEGEKPTYIHAHLHKLYGAATMDVSTVRRRERQIKEAETGEEQHFMTNREVVALALQCPGDNSEC
jgi:hypothetical protein